VAESRLTGEGGRPNPRVAVAPVRFGRLSLPTQPKAAGERMPPQPVTTESTAKSRPIVPSGLDRTTLTLSIPKASNVVPSLRLSLRPTALTLPRLKTERPTEPSRQPSPPLPTPRPTPLRETETPRLPTVSTVVQPRTPPTPKRLPMSTATVHLPPVPPSNPAVKPASPFPPRTATPISPRIPIRPLTRFDDL